MCSPERSRRAARRTVALALSACFALGAGCGSSSSTTATRPVAQRVCGGGQRAASAVLHQRVGARVLGRNPADLECVLSGRRLRVHVVSQSSAQAYTEFDTETSHQSQVYGAGVHEPAQQPAPVTVPGAVAAVWIRAQKMIVATDAMPGHGGTYLTVTVAGRPAPDRAALALAHAVAEAAFAAHPAAA